MSKKRLSIQNLKRICDAIGKKGRDGNPITEEEIRQWPSIKEEGKEK